jgi:UPF0755 protein
MARKKSRAKRSAASRVLSGLAGLVLLLAIPAGLAAWAWWRLEQPYKGYREAEKLVRIEPGMGGLQSLRRLEREGVLADAQTTRLYLAVALGGRPIQAGEYLFDRPLPATAVLRKLIAGDVATRSVTLVEGLTLEETAAQLVKAGMGRRDRFLRAMNSPRLIADLDPEAQDLEGYLFPDTYRFRRGATEPEIVEALVQMFRRRFARDVRPRLADPRQSVRHVVTLASIVEKEVGAASERPLVAAVYRNRLDKRMGLYADPTIIFALKKMGRWDGNLSKSDLRLESPYNSYRYAGLPPGPICSPGLVSLAAAAAPAAVPYLYFVSRNDGSHAYATTEAEHDRNVERWQRQYWRDKRNAGR